MTIRFRVPVAALAVSLSAAMPAMAGPCGLSGTGDWAAELLPPANSEGRPKLVVTGKAVTNTTGWKVELHEGPLTRSMPPIQMIELEVVKPTGVVGMAFVTHELRIELPGEPAYRAVRVVCGTEPVHEFAGLSLQP